MRYTKRIQPFELNPTHNELGRAIVSNSRKKAQALDIFLKCEIIFWKCYAVMFHKCLW